MACSAVDMGSPGYDNTYGFGIVDALGAMMQLNSSTPCIPNRTTTNSVGGGNLNNNKNPGSCGVDMEVPLKYIYWLPGYVLSTSTPNQCSTSKRFSL